MLNDLLAVITPLTMALLEIRGGWSIALLEYKLSIFVDGGQDILAPIGDGFGVDIEDGSQSPGYNWNDAGEIDRMKRHPNSGCKGLILLLSLFNVLFGSPNVRWEIKKSLVKTTWPQYQENTSNM